MATLTNEDLDLPPGVPPQAAGALTSSQGTYDASGKRISTFTKPELASVTPRPSPTVGAFRASGLPDVGQFLSPTPSPAAPVAPTPIPSMTTGWLNRATTGLLGLVGITPSTATTPITAKAPVESRTTQLEKNLDDLEKRSTSTSPFYQDRLKNYTVVTPAK
jgi:hypothetical protein